MVQVDGASVGVGPYNNGDRRHVGDPVWRSQIRGRLAKRAKWHAAEVLADGAKAYDNIRWDRLAANGRKHNYPMVILRVSMGTYKWSRYLMGDRLTTVRRIRPR